MTITAQPRTYQVVTYGCQMNNHDSERIAGLLEDAGYAPHAEGEQADLVVFNTCAVRENADNRLYGNLGQLRPRRRQHVVRQVDAEAAHHCQDPPRQPVPDGQAERRGGEPDDTRFVVGLKAWF